jgi:dephospho-CoA kinase
MLIVGITGLIASGKTFVTSYLNKHNYHVFDADRIARRSYYVQEIYSQIHNIFPELRDYTGDELRKHISDFIFADSAKLALLERIIHPYVRNEMHEFMADQKRLGTSIIFLDIPLLFENQLEQMFDKIIVIACGKAALFKRLQERGYNQLKIAQVLSKQLDLEYKKQRASFVIDTDSTEAGTIEQIEAVLRNLKNLVDA